MRIPRIHILVLFQSFLRPCLSYTPHATGVNRASLVSSRLFGLTTTATSSSASDTSEGTLHNVNGIICREVGIDVQNLGMIKILEATADSQDKLVEIACAVEEELERGDDTIRLNSSDPYGAVLWPAASAVSDYLQSVISKNSQTGSLEGMTILELGTGTGLCAMAAALGGASKVMATDYEEIPLRLLEYAAQNVNTCSGDSKSAERLSKIETFLFDICDHDSPLPVADLVVAADIMYEPKTGIAMAHRTIEALKAGSRVVIGCSPGRPGRPKFQQVLKDLLPEMEVDFFQVYGRTCSGPRNELICGEGSTSVSSEPKPLHVALMDIDPVKMKGFGTN